MSGPKSQKSKVSADGASAGKAPLASVSPADLSGAPMSTKMTMTLGGAFEGASRTNRRIASWAPTNRSADMDILPNKATADARSKDIARNDPLIQAGGMIHKDSIVGSSYTLNARPNTGVLRLDETWADEFSEEIESKFTLWAESSNNWPDASRMNTLTGLVRLAIGIDLTCGEVLSSAEWIREPGRPYKSAIQFIDVDRLSNPNGEVSTPTRRAGVERNRYGAPIGYHIRMAHPSDPMDPNHFFWKYVAARKPWGRLQVGHFLEQGRPGQTRGISDLVAGLSEMKMLKSFRSMVLENAIVNATYAATIESEVPKEGFAAIGADSEQDQLTQSIGNYLSAIGQYSSNNITMDGVKIPHLFPGTKLNLRPAGSGGPLGTEFEMSSHRYIAATLGVSYEELLHDYTNTNLSSAKAAFGNTEKRMKARKRYTADRQANMIYGLWFEEAMNTGEIEAMKFSKAPNYYEGLNSEAYLAAEWMGSGIASLDRLKDAQAASLELKAGLTTLEKLGMAKGTDWRKEIKQRGRERQLMIDEGLNPDFQDNSLNAASGSAQQRNPGSKQQKDGTSDRTKKQ
jgi:lambda family phage portal protein